MIMIIIKKKGGREGGREHRGKRIILESPHKKSYYVEEKER